MKACAARLLVVVCATSFLAACAAPPLMLYTLRDPAEASATSGLNLRPIVIEVARVTVPDELDTEDLVVRDGSTLRRSQTGRWASRLSLGVTDRLTHRLAASRPDALVTDQPQTEAPTDRVLINLSRLDVMTNGVATLQADWLIVPRDPMLATQRDRASFSVSGPVATDQDVVALEETLLDRLAGAIDVASVR